MSIQDFVNLYREYEAHIARYTDSDNMGDINDFVNWLASEKVGDDEPTA